MLGPWLALAGCAPMEAEAAREAWLLDQVVSANRAWLDREPARVGDKFERMAGDPWDYLRGSTSIWYADLARPDAERPPTQFLTLAAANDVLVVGDAHVENLATVLRGAEPDLAEADPAAPLPLEWVDLDAAGFGPWTLDVRRAAMALALFGGREVDEPTALAGATAVVRGYAGEVVRQAAGLPPWDAAGEPTWTPLFAERLRTAAREDGVLGVELADRTELTAGGRRLLRDTRLDAAGKGDLALTPEEDAQLTRLLDGWEATRPIGFRRLDAVRRYGQGVSSMPALRYVVLYDTGADGPEDDRLVALREVADPPLLGPNAREFASGPERVREVSAALWSEPDADVLADAVADGPMTFKVLAVTGWNQTFEVSDMGSLLAGGVAGPADVQALGDLVGRALAAAHARGHTGDGQPALPVLAADLDAGGGPDALEAELVPLAVADAERIVADHALFEALVEREGRLLGARWLRVSP